MSGSLAVVEDCNWGVFSYCPIAVSCSIDITDDLRLGKLVYWDLELVNECWQYEIIGGTTVNEGVNGVMEMCGLEEDCCMEGSFFRNESGLWE
jgi:hypothetical protein